MNSLENWMPEPPRPPAWAKVSPTKVNQIVTDLDAKYKKQRYERLLDSLVEYTEDLKGAEQFIADLNKALWELSKPQQDVLEAISRIRRAVDPATSIR